MSSKRLLIDLNTLPEEGREIRGEISSQIFDLPAGDPVPTGPVHYELRVQRFGSELLLTGSLAAPFEFVCVRTLHPFIQTITLPHAALSVEIDEGGAVDVTAAIREEILLEFPTDPRCDEADEPQHCEIDPRYLAVDKPGTDEVDPPARAGNDDRWSALDALQNPDPER